jgi:poly-gamma-glutamate synthesis protein (capsule biosynthesis protein)
MIKLIIGGDVCPKGRVENAFINAEEEKILNDLIPKFKNADFRIINLECPLIVKKTPIEKDGPILDAHIDTINGLQAIEIDAVNLANNHILDHGKEGLKSTIESCKKNGINFFGAAKNLEEAQKPLIRIIGGKRFCFMGYAEHEFSIATKTTPGANPLSIMNFIKRLKEIEHQFDYLIILYHGGKEYYEYPTPKQQEISRFFIDMGADAVISQHSHCAGTYEAYKDKLIVYGQGNFIFNREGKTDDSWNTGFLIELLFKGDTLNWSFIPFCQQKSGVGVQLLNGNNKISFLNDLDKRSRKLTNSNFVHTNWENHINKEKQLLYSRVLGHNKYLRFLNKKLKFTNWIFSLKLKMMIRNVVECETHREALLTILKNENE